MDQSGMPEKQRESQRKRKRNRRRKRARKVEPVIKNASEDVAGGDNVPSDLAIVVSDDGSPKSVDNLALPQVESVITNAPEDVTGGDNVPSDLAIVEPDDDSPKSVDNLAIPQDMFEDFTNFRDDLSPIEVASDNGIPESSDNVATHRIIVGLRANAQSVRELKEPFKRANPVRNNPKNIPLEFALQCTDCNQWRKVDEASYEAARAKFTEDPFKCICADPVLLERNEYDASVRWLDDFGDIPVSPVDYKRRMIFRSDFSRVDICYGKGKSKFRSLDAVKAFNDNHPDHKVEEKRFCFRAPRVDNNFVKDAPGTELGFSAGLSALGSTSTCGLSANPGATPLSDVAYEVAYMEHTKKIIDSYLGRASFLIEQGRLEDASGNMVQAFSVAENVAESFRNASLLKYVSEPMMNHSCEIIVGYIRRVSSLNEQGRFAEAWDNMAEAFSVAHFFADNFGNATLIQSVTDSMWEIFQM